jgi:hypothetical protein
VARASRVENRACALRIELARVTDSRPMQYRMAQTCSPAQSAGSRGEALQVGP